MQDECHTFAILDDEYTFFLFLTFTFPHFSTDDAQGQPGAPIYLPEGG
jgi:hypothetical protein